MKKILIAVMMLAVLLLPAWSYSSKLEEKLFYNLGHFGASFLYQTYFSIGMVSDAWTYNTYKPEDAKTILNTNVTFLETSRKLLTELTDFSINIDDRKTFFEMISIVDDLKSEAEYMLKYITSRNKADVDTYDRFRQSAWAKIAKLMDIK